MISTPKIDRAIDALGDAEAALQDLPDVARPPQALLGGVAGLTPEKIADEIQRLERIKVRLIAAVECVPEASS